MINFVKQIKKKEKRKKIKIIKYKAQSHQLNCSLFFRYIRHILAEIGFWLSQKECSKVNKFKVFFINVIEQNLIGLAK